MRGVAAVVGISMLGSIDLPGGGSFPLQSGGFDPGFGSLVALLLLASASTLVVTRLGHRPPEKWTHLFENDDGERHNPFEDLSKGAARSERLCDECGTVEVSPPIRYCVQCVSVGVRDD